MTMSRPSVSPPTLSAVIPVYGADRSLIDLVDRLIDSAGPGQFQLVEVLLVFDGGTDSAADVVEQLDGHRGLVRVLWLTRNFGQHAATFAGIASSTGRWVVTLDEDGQHPPEAIGGMLARAIAERAQVVYASPTNRRPHGTVRNAASGLARSVASRVAIGAEARHFHSFRLIDGAVARAAARATGPDAYLDIALSWVASRYALEPVELGVETRTSGYSTRRLIGHFRRLMLASGTRGLRLVSLVGTLFAVVGVLAAIAIIVVKLTLGFNTEGWASTIVALLISSGTILFALGVIAEYIGVTVSAAMGRPGYVVREPDPPTRE
jgi:polyisoprenyl-phosphate glycosyltransferase